MSDFIDLSQLARGLKTTSPAEPPAPSMAEMAAALRAVVEEQRREHRTVFCRPECADRIRAEFEAAGLAPWVTVVASDLVDEGRAYVAHTPLDENGDVTWLR